MIKIWFYNYSFDTNKDPDIIYPRDINYVGYQLTEHTLIIKLWLDITKDQQQIKEIIYPLCNIAKLESIYFI